jgi:formylglycine-generating enzyme required for sulfatase activity
MGLRQPLLAAFFVVPAALSPAPGPGFLAKQYRNSVGMEFMLVPAGKFLMGSPVAEASRRDGEDQHEVEFIRPFYLGKYEVTQAEYEAVTGDNPSWFAPGGGGAARVAGRDTKRFPAEGVSWEDAVKFCEKLTAQEKALGRRYRLPTEAEWEYACRAGTATPFHFGVALSSDRANVDGTDPYGGAPRGPYLERPAVVGSYPPNAWGLYDMHGNVWEWCADWYDSEYYRRSPKQGPPGPGSGSGRVIRGGSWRSYPAYVRSANRASEAANNRGGDHNHGFRVLLVTPGGGR